MIAKVSLRVWEMASTRKEILPPSAAVEKTCFCMIIQERMENKRN